MEHTAHKSNAKRIWFVFGLLSVVTVIEVIFGILKPDFLFLKSFFSLSLLNWLFIILTIFKAYYIVWAFMHMEGETKSLKWMIVGTSVFLIIYLVFILLVEGHYVFEVINNSTLKWVF